MQFSSFTTVSWSAISFVIFLLSTIDDMGIFAANTWDKDGR
ncbi:hypothetical protein BTHERMOSOX_1044 [Bathymodiolus thermophilus thioautotrophic gill symbiont]|uniref:Uncharacterized protein n=1 Tax=Bathymodiolus thermophilus thioautotrophic gill symbiont TaxID=2360 RepID=A0A8H8XD63_9GAMM|nr:hypothetical protein THERMOS_306 [Bathymodiolus thermophilus thioautotrophic gill symbiont]SHA29901.1 hypothetical protein BTHERMOSOX_1044 [Bathymodiolus thermophilus thioautotrophic gill symbiont]